MQKGNLVQKADYFSKFHQTSKLLLPIETAKFKNA